MEDALDLAAGHLKSETLAAFRHAQVCWFASLALYSNGGTPPEQPKNPDEDD